jgi:hypothetical protein
MMSQTATNTPNRAGYGTFAPYSYGVSPSPWYPNGVPTYSYAQPVVQQQPTYVYRQPEPYTTTVSPFYSAPLARAKERFSNGFNAFITGLVVDPITLLVDKLQQAAAYPFKGKKEALISVGVALGTVFVGTMLGGYGFVLAPLALAGLLLGGRDAFRFLKSQFSDDQTLQQKDNSWRQLAHLVGVTGLLMSLGSTIGGARIEGQSFIPFWKDPPADTTGWRVLHNTPQLAWLSIQRTLNGLIQPGNYSSLWNDLGKGTKGNGEWLIGLPKQAWEALQR